MLEPAINPTTAMTAISNTEMKYVGVNTPLRSRSRNMTDAPSLLTLVPGRPPSADSREPHHCLVALYRARLGTPQEVLRHRRWKRLHKNGIRYRVVAPPTLGNNPSATIRRQTNCACARSPASTNATQNRR